MANDGLLQGKYVTGKSSVVGDARRKWEDRVYAAEIKRTHGDPLVVGIVADGVGSADIGSRGAQLAVDTVVGELTHSQGNDIPELIEQAILAANKAVYGENEKNEKEAWTTLVVAVMYNNRCYIGNVGDSRAYWAQEDGTFLQLTRDHTFYNIYGGDPNAENAGAVVNAIGIKKETQVDPGFYLKPDMPKEQAHRIGYAGLPLKPGEAIVLCSDGLIKVDHQNKRYAKDEEIVNALQTEYEQDKAAIKMVGVAEGRRPTDNVSAVTIQCYTNDLIKQRQQRSAQETRARMVRNVIAGVVGLAMLAAIAILGFFLVQKPASITTTVVITLTPEPTLAPTATINPGQARVEDVYGDGANVKKDQMLVPNDKMIASDKGVKVVVGEQSTVVGQKNAAGVMFWFGDSAGNVNFDARHMMPLLEAGALYIRPGTNKAEVYLDQESNGMIASVEGSHMIVQRIENDIMVYCFEGKCRLDPGAGLDELKIEVGYKRLYRTALKKADDAVEMKYDEMWAWNVKCYYCMKGVAIIPTPTFTPKPIQIIPPSKTKKPDTYKPGMIVPSFNDNSNWDVSLTNWATIGSIGLLILGLFVLSSGKSQSRRQLIIPFGLVALIFVSYCSTLAPSIMGFDSAELTAGAYNLGIVHPTGYPLYLLIAHLFTLLPFPNVAYAVNLMSAVFGCLTILMVFYSLKELINDDVIALIASLSLGYSFYFWSLSVVAEVYTLHTFFISLQLYFLLRWHKTSRVKYWYLWSLFFGFSLSNHISGLFFTPGFLYMLYIALKNKALTFKNLIFLTLLIVPGLMFYFYLPLSALQHPKLNYAAYYGIDVTTLSGILWMFTGQAYRIFLGSYSSYQDWLNQVWVFVELLWKQTMGLGSLIGIWGLYVCFRRNRVLAIFTLIMFLAYTGFYISYNVIDKDTMFLPSYLIWTLWLGIGLKEIADIGKKKKIVLLQFKTFGWVFLLLMLFCNLPLVDKSHDIEDSEFISKVLAEAPKNSIIVADWSPAVILEYYQFVEGKRPDLVVYNRSRNEVAMYYQIWSQSPNMPYASISTKVTQQEDQNLAKLSVGRPALFIESSDNGYEILKPYGK